MHIIMFHNNKLTGGGSIVMLKNIAQPFLSLGSERSFSIAVTYVNVSFTAIISW